MRTEEEIRDYIKEIESCALDPETGEFDDDCVIDEGDQAALEVLRWVVGDSEQRW